MGGEAPQGLPHPVVGGAFTSPVSPGSGWPGDRATPATTIARSPEEVTRLAGRASDIDALSASISVCRACPRLVAWRERAAREKKREFASQPYWGRPVPGWGSETPKIVIVGLAPAANGGNRTGRVFTGDPSGDFLFAALYRAGIAALPTSTSAEDGQTLRDARLLAAVRCAPPENKPTVAERDICSAWFRRELEFAMPETRVFFALGAFAWSATLRALEGIGCTVPRPRPAFGHRAETAVRTQSGDSVALVASYHPSQRNTSTHTLTPEMFDTVLGRVKHLAGLDRVPSRWRSESGPGG